MLMEPHINRFEILTIEPMVGALGKPHGKCKVKLLDGKWAGREMLWFYYVEFNSPMYHVNKWLGLPTEEHEIPKGIGKQFHCKVVVTPMSIDYDEKVNQIHVLGKTV